MSSSSFLDQIPTWTLNAYYVEICNCNYGCPCNFNDFCRTLVLFHVRYEKYDGANLQGINMICAFSWPKTIYEGNEKAQLFITKNSDEEQFTRIQLPKGFIWKLAEAVKK